MTNWRTGVLASLMAMSVAWTSPAQAQGKDRSVPFQIVEATIDDIHAAFKSGKLTARKLVQGYVDRINAYDKAGPNINSVITINPDALEEADKLDAAYKKSGLTGPLHGIPVLVKDEIDTAGMPTTHGTIVFKDYRPPRDAFVVEMTSAKGIAWSTYLGGSAWDEAFGVVADRKGSIYVAGRTSSSDFPTVNAFQPALAGAPSDGFIIRLRR